MQIIMNNFSSYYDSLIKPDFFPPDYLFGIAWGIIYPMIAIAAVYMSYLIYKDKLPVSLIYAFVLNMISNVLFTPIQFSLQNNLLATIDIFVVLATLIVFEVIALKNNLYILFALMVPYLLWILFATFLQVTITWLN